MNKRELEIKKKLQRDHAWERGKERYDVYFCKYLYQQLLDVIEAGLSPNATIEERAMVKVLGDQEHGNVLVLKVFFIDEWMFTIYDRETGEVRTFLPRGTHYIKGMDVSAA